MKAVILALAILALGAQRGQTPMPPPGNPDHVKPADGQFCKHDPSDGAHNCACHRTCQQNIDEEGNPAPGEHVVEEYAKCRASCHEDHCHCPLHGCS